MVFIFPPLVRSSVRPSVHLSVRSAARMTKSPLQCSHISKHVHQLALGHSHHVPFKGCRLGSSCRRSDPESVRSFVRSFVFSADVSTIQSSSISRRLRAPQGPIEKYQSLRQPVRPPACPLAGGRAVRKTNLPLNLRTEQPASLPAYRRVRGFCRQQPSQPTWLSACLPAWHMAPWIKVRGHLSYKIAE